MTETTIRPFRIDVPQANLDDLADRLTRTIRRARRERRPRVATGA